MAHSSSETALRWGILSTGSIAHTFARGLREAKRGHLVAVASRTQPSADEFGDEFDIPHRHGDYQALIDNPDVDAIYIATPHPMHAPWAVKAADAGKHLLVEKPLTLDWAQAARVVEACERNGVQLLEAFMYRCHPQSAKLVEIIASGALGNVLKIEATFGFMSDGNPESRLINPELGGGGILDVGCYTMSLCRLIAGAAQGKPFADPLEIKALGKLNSSGTDNQATAIARFPGDIIAVCSCAVAANEGGSARIIGSKANLRIPSPFFCGDTPNLILESHSAKTADLLIPLHIAELTKDGYPAIAELTKDGYLAIVELVHSLKRQPTMEEIVDKLDVTKEIAELVVKNVAQSFSLNDETSEDERTAEIVVESPLNLYAYEADALAALVAGETLDVPAQTALDALGNMRALDEWRAQIGLQYPAETPERLVAPVSGEPLRVYTNAMVYSTIEGVTGKSGELKPIARIVCGTMVEGATNRLTQGLALFDDYFERGGNAFDTAHIYGTEPIVGHWLRTRGVRDDVTLIVKGAHTPDCTPDGLTRQLHQSLEKLGIERADIYMLHRDNLDVPVGEFVDVLNQHKNAGLMQVFGGSNWSLERLQAANEYAKSKGLQGLQVASNNFSLARLIEPVWAGCVSSSDAASRAWFEANHLSLFAWSSQARGFFARAARDFTADSELVRCWYSDDNFERLQRAQQLARKKNVSAVVIAAAYVLAQPFPIYALIGPRALSETRDSMAALEISLTPDEVKWLNLENEPRAS